MSVVESLFLIDFSSLRTIPFEYKFRVPPPLLGQVKFRILLAILIVHSVLLAYSASQQSPTANEPAHIVAGLSHLQTGRFPLFRVNPPLVRMIASLPSWLVGCNSDFVSYVEGQNARPVFEMGAQFVTDNKKDVISHIKWARWACIPFAMLGGWICFAWASDLFGVWSGLMASALWCCSPMVLGHASLITPDAHAASLGLAACYTFWRWLKTPTWRQAILTGIVLGLAELSKTTMILFYPLWPLLWVAYRWRNRDVMSLRRWRDEAGMLILRMMIGLYVLNLGYLGEGSFTQLKDFRFTSALFAGDVEIGGVGGNRFADGWFGEVPVPLPANYLIGIDVQQRDFEGFSFPSYLRGKYQAKGWWYYYGYAILVKAPLGTLGLISLAVLGSMFRLGPRADRRDLLILLAPAIIIFIVASLKYGFSHHSRYILPCIPFVFIWISGLARHIRIFRWTVRSLWFRLTAIKSIGRRRWISSALGLSTLLLLIWTMASSFSVYPHSLSYFNELAGGPRHGPEHLLNSNIDWGQDLLFLDEWIKGERQSTEAPVHLAFCNYYTPFDIAIDDIEPWPFRRDASRGQAVPSGLYAISVNLLYEFPWPLRESDGGWYFIDNRPMAYLRAQDPIGWAGYSIRIFSAEQVRAAYAAPSSMPLWPGF